MLHTAMMRHGPRLTTRCRAPLAQRTFTTQKGGEEGTKAAAAAGATGAAAAAAAAGAATEKAAAGKADNMLVRFAKENPSTNNLIIATIKTGAADLLA
jgi:hypothetical protein